MLLQRKCKCRPTLGLWASPGAMGSGQQCLAAGLCGHEMHAGPLAGPLVTLFAVQTDCSFVVGDLISPSAQADYVLQRREARGWVEIVIAFQISENTKEKT